LLLSLDLLLKAQQVQLGQQLLESVDG
jgi:hypothetical protein